MNKIIFWNVEHLSNRAAKIAEDAKAKAKKAEEASLTLVVSHHNMGSSTGVVTRGMEEKYKKRKASDRDELEEIRPREKRAKIASNIACDKKNANAARLIKKWRLSEDLVASAPHTFFCEVHIDHSHKRSPLLKGDPPGGGTLCYAYYNGGKPADFTNCPITDKWYVGPDFRPNDMTRVPRGVVINGSRGEAAGQAVRFCFWHAPSGNNGAIVAQMANGLNAGGQPFVPFGDLKAQPRDLRRHQLDAGVFILAPPGGTRISGRTLDYAVTNVPKFFHPCRRLYDNMKKNREIKQTTGSDHMVMVLELK